MNTEELIAKVPNLPAPSASILQLLHLLAQPEADYEAIASIVRRDGVLSAKLLSLCNAAASGLAAPVGSIDDATMHLGQNQIHRLIMSLAFGNTLSPKLPGYFIDEGELWRHSLLTGRVADHVVRTVPELAGFTSLAYTAGLIHDIGKILLSHAINRSSTQAALMELVETNRYSLSEAERETIGVDHAEAGACLLQKWRLPEALVESVSHHHSPTLEPSPQLSAVVHVADFLVHQTAAAPGYSSFSVRSSDAAFSALGLGIQQAESLILAAFDELTESIN